MRCICPTCRTVDQPDEEIRQALNIIDPDFSAFRGTGCDDCNGSGYRGRIGVYEIFQVDNEIKRMIHQGPRSPNCCTPPD